MPDTHTVILGDFNFPDICWDTLCGRSQNADNLCKFIFRLNLSQLVTFPTHSGGNILDLVLSSSPSYVKEVSPLPLSSPYLNSDHIPILVTLMSGIPSYSKPQTSWFYNYKATDFDGLNSYLLDFDFRPLLSSSSVEFAWSFIKQVIVAAVSLLTPMVRVKSHSLPKWFDSNIRHQLHKVHTIRRRHKRSPTASTFSKLVSLECSLQLSILEARTAYETSLVHGFMSSHDPSIYLYLRDLSGSSTIPSVMYLNNQCAENPRDIANLFNEFFYSVFDKGSSANVAPPQYLPDSSLCSISISIQDTFEALCHLNPTKAMGWDNISPSVLKHAATPLLEPLHHLFTICIDKACIPDDWKQHLIVPIPKTGDASSVCKL
ncbi:PREDICTED: uncharacterized protein LOC105314349 [Amphimedon queenslandica]|uniref:Endonuclease/exonuclease/phosphatase domain-containing protein n=1 Tax=Amphimedon queenslandica TaxID=400682 RepID=A0A1X7TV65_AMPQE|nr:PREDICTED: uncharacterized protein LOC105314349 [Amphimedon queenslandica]|eukprot:XP_011406763.1 PREDICTED: uncharacterized protein LOC105314349 [Amphimedon queenslandica]